MSPEPEAKTKKPKATPPDFYIDDTGHTVLRGSRWHVPKKHSPTECEIGDCDRVLGQQRRQEDLEADDETEEEAPEQAP